jgi:histidinol phosphatase-like enzyme
MSVVKTSYRKSYYIYEGDVSVTLHDYIHTNRMIITTNEYGINTKSVEVDFEDLQSMIAKILAARGKDK